MKLVFVTGVSRGLGYSILQKLLQDKITVVGMGRSDHEDHSKLAKKNNTPYQFLPFDLENISQSQHGEKLLHQIKGIQRNFNQIILIHNAAVSKPVGLLHTLNENEVRNSIEANLTGPIVLSKIFAEYYQSVGCPLRMIHVSSGAATRPVPGSNIYCIAKAGLEMLVRGISSESQYLPVPIESIGIRPGIIDTDMQKEMRGYPKEQLPYVQYYQDAYNKGELKRPADVADLIVKKLVYPAVENGKIYNLSEL